MSCTMAQLPWDTPSTQLQLRDSFLLSSQGRKWPAPGSSVAPAHTSVSSTFSKAPSCEPSESNSISDGTLPTYMVPKRGGSSVCPFPGSEPVQTLSSLRSPPEAPCSCAVHFGPPLRGHGYHRRTSHVLGVWRGRGRLLEPRTCLAEDLETLSP